MNHLLKCPFGFRGHSLDEDDKLPIMTRSNGEPIPNLRSMLTVGPRGPALMGDHIFLEEMQHVARGRIPERLFHAKGNGVHGYFEVTHDISKYCAAKMFSEVGKRTPQFTRFSVGNSELGSADTTTRGLRGLATKFYTEDGNFDLTMLSEPVLSVNDPIALLSITNSARRDSQSNLPVADRIWDFATQTPESVHFLLFSHTDRGIPDGYRHANWFAQNTFKLINRHGEYVFARFQFNTDQGVRNLEPERAVQLAGANPDYFTQDLLEAIDRGDYPSFTLNMQVMTPEQAEEMEYNPFNVTKVWSHKRFPLMPVGKLVMNRNVANHWDEAEQSAFWPGNFVPGIRAADGDLSLHSRIMVYRDSQVYRLGVNHSQLPVNQPKHGIVVKNYQREGRGVFVSQGSAPIYFPNSFGGPVESERAQELDPSFKICGTVGRYTQDDPFSQPRDFWLNVLDDAHRTRTIMNLAVAIRPASRPIQKRAVELFANIDEEMGRRLADELGL